MFRVATEEEFLKAFRPRDRKHVEVPPGTKFPLIVLDYLSWSDPAGARVFVVFAPPGERRPTGIAFRKDQSKGGVNSSRMCEWCHSQGSSDEIALLTTWVNSKKRVGTTLCLDLGCGHRVEEAADRSGKNRQQELKKLLARMEQFSREALGITEAMREQEPAQ